jgi:hypothetical protein
MATVCGFFVGGAGCVGTTSVGAVVGSGCVGTTSVGAVVGSGCVGTTSVGAVSDTAGIVHPLKIMLRMSVMNICVYFIDNLRMNEIM